MTATRAARALSLQVRTLRKAGYDGVVLGRALAADPLDAEALVRAIRDEAYAPRMIEQISVPARSRPAEEEDFQA